MAAKSGRSAWGGRLLLFAALLLGIVTMHTLGHPSGEHGEHGRGPVGVHATTVVAAVADPPPTAAGPVDPGVTTRHAPHAAHEEAAVGAPSLDPPRGPLPGMDPMSVCLAVLAAWGVVLLGACLLTGRVCARAASSGGSAPLRATRPRPPPRKAVLARLSVLRI